MAEMARKIWHGKYDPRACPDAQFDQRQPWDFIIRSTRFDAVLGPETEFWTRKKEELEDWQRQSLQKGKGKGGGKHQIKRPRITGPGPSAPHGPAGGCYRCGGDHFERDCPLAAPQGKSGKGKAGGKAGGKAKKDGPAGKGGKGKKGKSGNGKGGKAKGARPQFWS